MKQDRFGDIMAFFGGALLIIYIAMIVEALSLGVMDMAATLALSPFVLLFTYRSLRQFGIITGEISQPTARLFTRATRRGISMSNTVSPSRGRCRSITARVGMG